MVLGGQALELWRTKVFGYVDILQEALVASCPEGLRRGQLWRSILIPEYLDL